MKNEEKEMNVEKGENIIAVKEAEKVMDDIQIVEGEGIFTGLFVGREYYERDGKQYFWCFVSGKIRGKDVRVGLVPVDFGGYEVVDIVFGAEQKVGLYKYLYEMRDEHTKRTVKGFTYKIQSQDDDGVYAIKLKPARDSDKALLEMLLNQVEKGMKK